MIIITDERCTSYHHAGHPERPARITSTVTRLKAQKDIPLSWESPGQVSDESLLRAHTQDHLIRLKRPENFDEDTPYFPNIEALARLSCGAALKALELARAGSLVFSLMRPPGHHATRQKAMGFCYLNNAAVVALEAKSAGCKRIAVYDFDVHHGNGTEAILLNEPGVSFYSIHQHPCYPGTGTRNVGNNCYNFPVPPHTARLEYRHVLESALDHLKQSKPDLIVVSAGFDAYSKDPLAQGTLEAEDYAWLGDCFRRTSVPVVSLLEGGYSDDLPELILAYLKGLCSR